MLKFIVNQKISCIFVQELKTHIMKKILGLALIATMIMSCSSDDTQTETVDCNCIFVDNVQEMDDHYIKVKGYSICDEGQYKPINYKSYIVEDRIERAMSYLLKDYCPE